MEKLSSFFEPKSVVILGASRNPSKLGYGVARNMIRCGFNGEIYLVNPKGGEAFGHKLISSIDELPGEIDLGLVVVPAKIVPETLVACSQKGIKHFIIITGGFSEAGPEGAIYEQQIAKIVQTEGVRVIGPNCIGILDTHLPLDTTFIQPSEYVPGEVAFITHSGALGAAMIDWARGEGFNFSRVISLGNQIDVTESDVLLPTAANGQTAVVTMYVEGISDGSKFIHKATKASIEKPVIALKVGRSKAGQKAAASHTGALAGADHAFSAAFRKAGILRATTTREMFSWAKMFAWSELPENNRVVVLTNAGGPGVTAVDAVSDHGLQMASLSERTRAGLSKILPSAASIENPIDMLASASPRVYAECLGLILADEGVDMVLVIAPPPPMFDALEIVRSCSELILKTQKPVSFAMMGSELVADAVSFLREKRIPEYQFPEEAISAMGALWRYKSFRERDSTILSWKPSVTQQKYADKLMADINREAGFVDPKITTALLEAYGLPILRLNYASTCQEAVEKARELNYPVVMKLAVEGISHKSDVGGILLGLDNEEDVLEGFHVLESKFLENEGAGKFGVYIQKMLPKGQEVIIGAVRDPIFGPLLMFGSGGTDVEGMQDISFGLAPLARFELDEMINDTWAGRKLAGYRNVPAADAEAVKHILGRIAQLMLDYPEIQEIEINPLILLEKGSGEWVVDARMVL